MINAQGTLAPSGNKAAGLRRENGAKRGSRAKSVCMMWLLSLYLEGYDWAWGVVLVFSENRDSRKLARYINSLLSRIRVIVP